MRVSVPQRVLLPALLLAAGILARSGVPASAQGLYPQFPALSNPGAPHFVLTGEFTGDGIEDLVVASPVDGRIRVHGVHPDGSFYVAASVLVGGQPASLAAGDFDRDGNLDLAWADALTGDVGVLLLTPGSPLSVGLLRQTGPDEATSVVMVDPDLDGWKELRAAHGGADALVAYPNLSGDLGPGLVENVGDRPDRLAVVEHTGGPTLVVRQSGRLSRNLVLTNLSSGQRDEIILLEVGEIFALDFDGNGEEELVYADEASSELVALERVGSNWVEGWRFGVDARVTGVAAANAEPGLRRLAVASEERRRTALYRIDGRAVTRESTWYGSSDMGLALYEDLDRDGSPEVLVTHTGLNRLQILPPLGDGLLGQEAATAPRGAVHLGRGTSVSGGLLLVVSGSLGGQLGVYAVNGSKLGEPLLLDAAPGVRAARFGQLDGTDDLDLASVSRTGGVRTHLSDGFGGYVPGFSFVPAGSFADLALVDVMGSPALDLVLASLEPPALVVHEGLGDGSFDPVPAASITTLEPLVVVRAHDLDLDGRDDIVALGFDSRLTIFQNRAGEPLAGTDLLVENAPRDVAIGNFNSDGLPDLITVNEGGSDFTVCNSVLPGVYTVAVRGTPSLSGARRIEVRDFDQDGADDFCVISNATRTVGVHLNLGTAEEPEARFSPPVQYELVESATDFALADLDADGKPDLIGIDGVADVLVSRLSDPLSTVAPASAQLQLEQFGGGIRVRVFSTAEHAHDLRLLRQPGRVVLSLVRVEAGIFEAVDHPSPDAEIDYVVEDRRGDVLDRQVLGARVATAAAASHQPVLLPTRYAPGRAVLRMRAAAGVIPKVRIFDLRGRRIADLTPEADAEGWFEATWTGTDFRGRPVSRGRYLVRASLGPVTGSGSIHLR